MRLQLDLDALGAERAQNRVPPAEARNHVKSTMRMPCSGNGLPRFDGGSFVSTRAFAPITGVSRFGFASTRRRPRSERRAASRYPRVRRGDPFARRIAERLAQLRMLDVGHAPALEPVRIDRVLVRLAQRRPAFPVPALRARDVLVVNERTKR